MQATAEQLEAIRAFHTNENLRINAFAGTGKTTTLTLLSKETSRRGMYLAFNKSIAADAKSKFPANVTCSTVHSLAFRATPGEFKRGDKMTGRLNANALAQELKLEDWFVGVQKVSARSQAHLVLGTLRRFMHGDRDNVRPEDVPILGRMKMMSDAELGEVTRLTLDRASQVWDRLRDPADRLPLGHDGYLKLWALSKPRLAADFIMLDEAQDTNPVVLGVLKDQPCQIIYVGDRHQQIYEWRGAVNAMEKIDTPHETYLTTSFRFGPEIAAAATNVLRHLGETHALRGNSQLTSFLAAEGCRAILARTNASVISTVIAKVDAGYSVHVVGGVDEIIRMLYAVSDLKRGQPSELPEFFGFQNWNEVVEFSKSDEGEELRTFVGLVEQHGEKKLIAILKSTENSEDMADLVVSTAHKAKGREWESVELLDDFLKSKPSDPQKGEGPPRLDPAEVRLFYVALTRGKEAVNVSPTVLSMFGISPTRVRPGGPRVRPTRPQFTSAALPSSSERPSQPQRMGDAVSQPIRSTQSAPETKPNLLQRYWWMLPMLIMAYLLMRK